MQKILSKYLDNVNLALLHKNQGGVGLALHYSFDISSI